MGRNGDYLETYCLLSPFRLYWEISCKETPPVNYSDELNLSHSNIKLLWDLCSFLCEKKPCDANSVNIFFLFTICNYKVKTYFCTNKHSFKCVSCNSSFYSHVSYDAESNRTKRAIYDQPKITWCKFLWILMHFEIYSVGILCDKCLLMAECDLPHRLM